MSAANESFQAPPPEAKPRAPRPVKLRPFAIGIIVIGAIILGGGIAKFIPGGIGTGAAVAFFGILLLAFSFIPLPVIPEAEPPLSFFDRIAGIFYEAFTSVSQSQSTSALGRRLRHHFGAHRDLFVCVCATDYARANRRPHDDENRGDGTTIRAATGSYRADAKRPDVGVEEPD